MKELYKYLTEALFSNKDFYKHNYLNDVIYTLCNKDQIRIGKNGEEIFNIDASIQQQLKNDFENIKDIDIDKFNTLMIKYKLPVWNKIFKGDFSGYSAGLASKNQGNAFEIDYVNNFEEKYKEEFEKETGIVLGNNYQITLEGSANTKRPLSKKGKILYLGSTNPNEIGAMLKDALIKDSKGNEYNISLKTSEKVSFINTGVKDLFPEKIFKEYEKTGKFIPLTKNNVNGQEILDMFGIDGNRFAEVFNKYSNSPNKQRSNKDEVDVLNIVKHSCFMDLMKTVVGCNYILVHKLKNKVHIYDLRKEVDMNKFIGNLESAKVLYPNDGKAKRVDVIIETSGLKLIVNLRAKDGGIYPTHLQCDYIIK